MMENLEANHPAHGRHRPVNVRNLLRRFDIRPDKRLGQNFLIDRRSLEKVVRAAALEGDECVIEVGAGLGSLTQLLSKYSKKVFAIEVDNRLIPALRFALQGASNVQIIEADVIKLNFAELIGDSKYIIAANIPYYLTSALIRKMLEASKPADRIVLTIQKEVAERVLAPVGKYSLLTLSVLMYGDAHIAGYIPAKAFYPAPKVESAILRIVVHPKPSVPFDLVQPVFTLAKAGFSQKRKQLRNSLSSGLGKKPDWVEGILYRVGIDPRQRAQELRLEEWVALAREIFREAV